MKSIEWLSGILEGEGCFSSMKSGSSGNYTTPLISLVMTDGDIVHEAGKLFFLIGERDVRKKMRKLPSKKIAYSLYVTGLPAARIMHEVLPHMGERRTRKIKSILHSWNPKKYKEAVSFKNVLVGCEDGVK